MTATPYEILAQYDCQTGECPLWHRGERRLHWTDIPTGRLMWYDPDTNDSGCYYHDRPVGGFTFQSDGSTLAFRDKGNVVVLRGGQVVHTVIQEIPDERQTRFNDVIADPVGRVFAGTMPTPNRKGRLYRIDLDGSYHILLEGIGVSNGMGFVLDDNHQAIGLHFTDTPTGNIYRFDYEMRTGEISNQQVFIHLDNQRPDGMTIDQRGHVYTAIFGGGGVLHYDAAGNFLDKIEVPADACTSCIFAPSHHALRNRPVQTRTSIGDPQDHPPHLPLDRLYIISAQADKRPDSGEHAGALFRVDVASVGRPEYDSRIHLAVESDETGN